MIVRIQSALFIFIVNCSFGVAALEPTATPLNEKRETREKPVDLIPPAIALKDISILSISFDSVRVGIDLHVENPNTQELVVEHIQYSLRLEENVVKSGVIKQLERFPPISKRDVHVPVLLPFDENVPVILNAIRTMSSNYTISGAVKIQGRDEPLPFVHKGQLSLLSGNATQ